VRAEVERARGRSPAAAVARGLGFVERALAVDAQLVRARRVRDALMRPKPSTDE
jgi:hypothetical protein